MIRANEGDCVEINVTNSATGGTYGMHIDGLAVRPSRRQGRQQLQRRGRRRFDRACTATIVPNDKALEGAHYISPGAGHRDRHRPWAVRRAVGRAAELAVAVAEGRDDADPVGLGGRHLAGRRPVVP